VKQVKEVEHQGLVAAVGQRSLQRGEAGDAILVERHQFAVHHRRIDVDLADSFGDGRQPVGPVVAVTGQQSHLTVIERGQ
jgi:hypothetical protein